ncbi:hypothetical protein [Lacrimispora sp.]|uniref:hypothetical protein n=1 Tax=Lacrimispora sp. TaxID=2719234 RepID=UPI0028B26784|nr:hypothetical protein [Lacrimispora sp.]
MAQLIRLNREEAAKLLLEDKCDIFLVVSHDLEKDKPLGKKRVDRNNGIILVSDSKTFVLNKDNDGEDSFSILSLYSALQRDVFNIEPRGIKHDMMLIPYKLLE